MLDIVINDCDIVTPRGVFTGWIGITGETFAAFGSRGTEVPAAHRTIEAPGLTALPGRIEPHLHLLGSNFEEDVREVSRQAAAGGTTTLLPLNRATRSYHELHDEWVAAVASNGLCDFVFQLQIQTPQHIREIASYRTRFGTPMFKLHMDYRVSHPVVNPLNIERLDDGDLYLTMLEVAEHGGRVAVHCENTEIAIRTTAAVRDSGRDDLFAWEESRPAICEAMDIDLVGMLATRLGCPAHVVHLSSALGLEAAARYPRDLLTVETTIPFLTMTNDEAALRLGSAGKMIPPLRAQGDVEALWAGVKSGRIRTIGTDHVLRRSVRDVSVWDAPVGASFIEFALPLLLTHGCGANRLSLTELATVLCDSPAALYGIGDRKRGLVVGGDADLTLVDLNEWRRVTAEDTITGYLTPVEGLDLMGWPKLTMLRGMVTFDVQGPARGGGGIVLMSTI